MPCTVAGGYSLSIQPLWISLCPGLSSLHHCDTSNSGVNQFYLTWLLANKYTPLYWNVCSYSMYSLSWILKNFE